MSVIALLNPRMAGVTCIITWANASWIDALRALGEGNGGGVDGSAPHRIASGDVSQSEIAPSIRSSTSVTPPSFHRS